jgi:DNA repair/transcription protein MET18/MMS19
MKALVQSIRFLVFSIIDTIMARHREGLSFLHRYCLFPDFRKVLKGMNNEFLSGYIALADGEKDPRNLLIAFAIARVILIEFNISDHIEVVLFSLICIPS